MIYIVNKKIVLCIIVSLLTFSFNENIFGQYNQDIGNPTASGLSISIDDGGVPNDPTLQANKINYIDTMFCNNGLEENKLTKNLYIVARPGEKKIICIVHINRNKEDIYLWGRFPDNAIESNGNTNCSTNYERTNPFSKFMKPFENTLIRVPAKSYVIRKTTIKFPVGTNGIQKGCFAYGVNQGILQGGENIVFVERRISTIDISIEGKEYTQIDKLIDIAIKSKDIILFALFIFIIVFVLSKTKKKK